MKKHLNEHIYGIHPVSEAVNAGSEIEKILVRKDLENDQVKELLRLAYRLNIPIQKVPVEKLNRITRKNHQGIIAFLSVVNYASLDNLISEAFGDGRDPVFLMLDRITDVRNFGNMARTAEGLGFDGIIIPAKGAAQLNSESMSASAGALMHIPVCRVKSLISTVNYLQNNGVRIICCTEKTNDPIYEVDLTGPACLVLGSEFDGISHEILDKADQRAKIPMYGEVDSYNVAVSMAIAGSELIRQRKFR